MDLRPVEARIPGFPILAASGRLLGWLLAVVILSATLRDRPALFVAAHVGLAIGLIIMMLRLVRKRWQAGVLLAEQNHQRILDYALGRRSDVHEKWAAYESAMLDRGLLASDDRTGHLHVLGQMLGALETLQGYGKNLPTWARYVAGFKEGPHRQEPQEHLIWLARKLEKEAALYKAIKA